MDATYVLPVSTRFVEIERWFEALGWEGGVMTGAAPVVAGEPELAMWRHGAIRASYELNPVVSLRMLRIEGASRTQLNAMLELFDPVDEDGVLTWLRSEDDEDVLRGLLAVEALGWRGARSRVDALTGHARPLIASTARRVGAATRRSRR